MIAKIREIDPSNKKLVSFDVKSLFTNVPIQGAIEAIKRALDANPDTQLPVPKQDFIRLVRLCVEFGAFEFEGMEYKPINGLAMGSPLSPVLACLFMEMLEADHFLGIIGPNTVWVRYVDDVLLITDNDQDLTSLLGKIMCSQTNSVHL